jgi:hypothetical protein
MNEIDKSFPLKCTYPINRRSVIALTAIVALIGIIVYFIDTRRTRITIAAYDKIVLQQRNGQKIMVFVEPNLIGHSDSPTELVIKNESTSPETFQVEDVLYCDREGKSREIVAFEDVSIVKEDGKKMSYGPEAQRIIKLAKYAVLGYQKHIEQLDPGEIEPNDFFFESLGNGKNIEVVSTYSVHEIQHNYHGAF